jgi:hypothetical protein
MSRGVTANRLNGKVCAIHKSQRDELVSRQVQVPFEDVADEVERCWPHRLRIESGGATRLVIVLAPSIPGKQKLGQIVPVFLVLRQQLVDLAARRLALAGVARAQQREQLPSFSRSFSAAASADINQSSH